MGGRPAALASVLLAGLATAQERREVPTFSSQVDLVTVDVVVLDDKGELVRGLTAADFTLFEDGHPQPIASFEAYDAPTRLAAGPPGMAAPVATNQRAPEGVGRPFVLLVDDMSLSPSRQEDVSKAIVRFLAEGVRDGDEIIFATTSRDAWWSARMPEGREDLEALAARVRGRNLSDTAPDAISEWEAFRITSVEGMEDGARGAPGEGGPASGPPTGRAPPRIGVPGSSLTERVRQRYLQRRVCDPLQAPALCFAMVRSRAQQVDTRRRNRTRDVLAAVDRAVFALTGVRGRKALLLLTEGFLSDPDLGTVQGVASRCREANIAVYSVDARGLVAGLAGTSAAFGAPPDGSELALMRTEQIEFSAAGSVGLAEDTGGFAVRNTNDLAGGAARAAAESRTYYLLGYAPPADKSPLDWRRLKVEVRRPELKVRARRGYTLRTAAEIAAAAQSRPPASTGRAPSIPAEVARAMANAHLVDAIPLRAMAYVLEERPGGTVRTVIAVEADTRSLANLGGAGETRATVSLSIVSTHRDTGQTVQASELMKVDGGASTSWEGWLVLSRPFDVLPGVNQARIVVRDEFLGRLGALTLRFVVPAPGGLRISTPLLTDRVTPARNQAPARPALVARREFAPVGPLYCQFQVFGASGVEAAVELRGRAGDVVRRSTPTLLTSDAEGRLTQLLAVPIDGLPLGEYELVVRVQDKANGRTSERVEPLTITRRAS